MATPSTMTPFHVTLLAVSLHLQDPSQPRIECRAWQECRQLALDAAARQDFETFHDLAWRAVQTGPKNDAALMYLLARAQSLSGRPGDALVMLQRLTQMGVQTDAATNEDFRRVRALPAWAELENDPSFRNDSSFRLKAEATPSAGATPIGTVEAGSSRPTSPPTLTPAAEPRDDAKRPETSPAASSTTGPVESLRFTTAPFTPAGLAYDAVSRRFIVGDRDARKLAVVDEFSQHVANLVGAQSTGFGQIAALEIDPRLGNLWVVTADDPQTTLHKLQLVSGRSLGRYEVPGRFGAARFTDVAATGDSTVLVLDTAGHRLFRLDAKAQALELAVTLPDQHATSLAPGANDAVYVAHDGGILLVDLASRAVTPLGTAAGVDVSGIARLRWHKGSLIAVQQTGPGTYRAIRIALGRSGRTATASHVLDASLETADPTAATVSGGVLYYLASGDGGEMIVRKVTLQ
jgi:hypothetical protein